MVELKSTPSNSKSISMYACAEVDSVRLARSHAVRRRRRARWFDNSTRRWSKSSPPKCVSPAVALTSKIPSSIVSSETSNVPPPRSKISTLCSPPFLSSP
ncbi:uncharacterized protein PITG_11422 [Phytophthora infestans T30-4]|uniref:Uncharacterized protein n=1 Tax=Phytophthora infestans (strain T30-4) TaxID=403677 RepID=D0NIR0_PHYIT|nr:uncharacterized protein PITG_11422 [Phytophthora infestans T30-4]EEY59394.1 conserved hypothetical protein [Phytophthora infestans T30-4]|eukprot:XP_002901004.1 conserved hypothetical protein [Phytophthora infestans T30-4]